MRLLIYFVSVVVGVSAFLATTAWIPAKKPDTRSAVLLVSRDNGHGSGVHIGRGYILTAAHVVKGATEVDVEAESGGKSKAEVVWISEEYDVALLKTEVWVLPPEGDLNVGESPLTCKMASIGDAVKAVGNPRDLRFIRTYGHVAAAPRALEGLNIRVVLTANLSVWPGMSGGPVYNAQNELVGIVSALWAEPGVFDRGASMPIAFFIPSSTICTLLAR